MATNYLFDFYLYFHCSELIYGRRGGRIAGMAGHIELNMKITCYKEPYETTGVSVVIPGFEQFSFAAFLVPFKYYGGESTKWLVAEINTGLPVQRQPADTIDAAVDLATFELIRRGGAKAIEAAIKSNRI